MATIKITDLVSGSIDSTKPDLPFWQGTGILDVLIMTINSNIKIQLDTMRITNEQYAEVYMGLMQTAMSESIKLLLNKDSLDKDLELKQAQIAKINAEKSLVDAQIAAYNAQNDKDLLVKQAQADKLKADKDLIIAQTLAHAGQNAKDLAVKQANIDLLNRQKEGFDDNKYQKLFEAQMNAWALMFSSGLLTDKPTIISNDSASSLYNTLKPK